MVTIALFITIFFLGAWVGAEYVKSQVNLNPSIGGCRGFQNDTEITIEIYGDGEEEDKNANKEEV